MSGYVGLALALARIIAALFFDDKLRGEADATDGPSMFLFMAVPPIVLGNDTV